MVTTLEKDHIFGYEMLNGMSKDARDAFNNDKHRALGPGARRELMNLTAAKAYVLRKIKAGEVGQEYFNKGQSYGLCFPPLEYYDSTHKEIIESNLWKARKLDFSSKQEEEDTAKFIVQEQWTDISKERKKEYLMEAVATAGVRSAVAMLVQWCGGPWRAPRRCARRWCGDAVVR